MTQTGQENGNGLFLDRPVHYSFTIFSAQSGKRAAASHFG
jgi:hypothetical protein